MTDAAVNILANMTQEADPPLTATEDAGAVAWVLTSTALVFLMTAGLGFFYGGLVRDTNIINTMMMSVVSMGIVTLTWVVFGFSWAFGDNGETGIGLFIGNFDYSFWTGLDMKNWDTLPGLAFASFQMTFAIIASAIISGSLVERVRFSAYCIMLALWSLLIYAPLCHWVWGPGGWIGQLGALDFAGGTVVHISSGVSGLVAGAILGPRKHVEKDLGPANAPFVILGGCLLWFGWLGFNGGSALSTTDGVAARAVATTFVAAASSMLTWLALERILKGKSTSVGASVGAVAGLVVITPAAGFVTPGWSIAIGALGAPWCYLTVEAVNRINLVDDTLDAFGLHGSGGFAGAILTGIFAVDEGLIYSGSFLLLGKQIAGALAGVAFSAVGTAIIVGVMRQTAERILTEMMNVDLSMGVTTVYRKELVECKVTTPDKALQEKVGLPTMQEWSSTDPQGNTKFFQWLTEAQAEAQKVKLSVHGSHISTLVRAPIGLDEEALKEYLKSCGIDITKFGQDGTKSLKEFSSELIKGETRLLQVPSGEILVITEVVMMILQNPETKETLVQTGQVWPDGKTSNQARIPGAKRRPDENQFLCARRILKRQLEIDENAVRISQEVGYIEEDRSSKSYPGLKTVYRKRIIKGEVIPGA
ncbi:amt [Symbiodinium sp. CCMP2592]|nr:amt [Symbiodinium sp. CCMP2592]